MGAETAAAEAIKKQAKEVSRVAKKFNFQELAPKVAKLKAMIEKANKLPGANPDIDPEEFEYPFEKQSAYLRGDKGAEVIAKIEAEAPAHKCACEPSKCQCSSSDETIASADGLRCNFCNDAIAMGGVLHTSEATGVKMCAVCARILWEKVRLKESVGYAVINLIEDASSEADPPYFQFKQSLKHVEEAEQRMAAFRSVQRAKSGRE